MKAKFIFAAFAATAFFGWATPHPLRGEDAAPSKAAIRAILLDRDARFVEKTKMIETAAKAQHADILCEVLSQPSEDLRVVASEQAKDLAPASRSQFVRVALMKDNDWWGDIYNYGAWGINRGIRSVFCFNLRSIIRELLADPSIDLNFDDAEQRKAMADRLEAAAAP